MSRRSCTGGVLENGVLSKTRTYMLEMARSGFPDQSRKIPWFEGISAGWLAGSRPPLERLATWVPAVTGTANADSTE
jgi:hypothetical protein